MKADEVLHQAAQTLEQRGRQYDQPEGERSMGRAVAALNTLTGLNMTEPQGWLLMVLIKLVRDGQRRSCHPDSLLDLTAYAALYGEARHAESPDNAFERAIVDQLLAKRA